ncbi:hypothetical protein FN846DRAFT_902332 [Sphaerosporella brunnea]|uniref:Uncharacterized protein n=1 Tax=Sphaerosporella brunnea TaxID=1250544 RepID=A0A5J5FAC8_9PEZI|nr:hypothetical protein FN846DRAFT_902332 [Sphaerosporella brunnea]
MSTVPISSAAYDEQINAPPDEEDEILSKVLPESAYMVGSGARLTPHFSASEESFSEKQVAEKSGSVAHAVDAVEVFHSGTEADAESDAEEQQAGSRKRRR